MKKGFCYSAMLASIVCFAAFNAEQSVATPNVPDLAKAQAISNIMHEKCLSCHSKGYDLPFYASIPGIKSIIEKDFRDGLRAMNITHEFSTANADKPFNQAALAKIEWVILNDSMPPAKFAMVHWGSTLSSAEKKQTLEWVYETRKQHYATGDMARASINEPIQPVYPVNYDKAQAALGERLFNDKRLSADSTLACSGCHDFQKGGTDQQKFSEGIKKQFGDINAPTVLNAVFNIEQFWDGRAKDLQAQAGGPPLNPIEMGSKNWEEIIARLAQDEKLSNDFKQVYADGWSEQNITHAIAEFEKTLVTPDSRFDLFLKGDGSAITADEKRGYELFKLYRCASCHVGQAVGGASYEYLDLKADYFAQKDRPALGSDKGRFAFTQNVDDMHKFKVPTLRNVEYTWPYMHDGSVTTLDSAVQIMGDYLSGISVPEKDRKLIVAFLRSLSGKLNGEELAGAKVAQ